MIPKTSARPARIFSQILELKHLTEIEKKRRWPKSPSPSPPPPLQGDQSNPPESINSLVCDCWGNTVLAIAIVTMAIVAAVIVAVVVERGRPWRHWIALVVYVNGVQSSARWSLRERHWRVAVQPVVRPHASVPIA